MRFTVFGIFWIILIIRALSHSHPYQMINLLLFGMTLQRAVILYFIGQDVGPQVITSAAFIFWYIIHRLLQNGRLTISKRHRSSLYKSALFSCIFLIATIYISYLQNRNLYISEERWMFILYCGLLIIYIICFLCVWNIREDVKVKDIEHIFNNVIWFVVIIGIMQFVHSAEILDLSLFLNPLLFNQPVWVYVKDHAWRYTRLYSVYMEPSYTSAFLVGAFLYTISRLKMKYEKVLSLIILTEIILTFSSTAYGDLIVGFGFYLILSRNKKAIKYLFPLGVICIVLIALSGQLMPLLNDVIFQKMQSGSGNTRNGWNQRTLRLFLTSPVWGVGYKNARGSSFLYSVLGQLGITGLISWISLWLPFVIYAYKNRFDLSSVSSVLFLICSVLSMVIAVPDMDFCVFWQGMYMVALLAGRN